MAITAEVQRRLDRIAASLRTPGADVEDVRQQCRAGTDVKARLDGEHIGIDEVLCLAEWRATGPRRELQS